MKRSLASNLKRPQEVELSKATSLKKRSIRIGKTGEADREVQIGCNSNHNPEELLLVAALFNGTPACTQANNEQKFSVGIETDGQLVVIVGKAVEFRRAIIGMMNHDGHQRRKGFVDPTAKAKAASAKAKAASAAEEVFTSIGWHPGEPFPALA